MLSCRASERQSSTVRVVGFSTTRSKTTCQTPAARSDSSALARCPARTIPGSVATSTRVAPYWRASSPKRPMVPGPNTIRVRGAKSNSDVLG